MLNLDAIIAFASFLSGAGAVVSAIIAWRSVHYSNEALKRANDRGDRQLWKEIASQAAQAKALHNSVNRVGEELKSAYNTLFTFSSTGYGNSRLALYLEKVREKLAEADEMANNSRVIGQNFANPNKMNFESAIDSNARLGANIIRLELLLDLFKDELGRIERQNDQHRQKTLDLVNASERPSSTKQQS